MKYLNMIVSGLIAILTGLFFSVLLIVSFGVLFSALIKIENETFTQILKIFTIGLFILIWLLTSGFAAHFIKTIAGAFRFCFLLWASGWLFFVFALSVSFLLTYINPNKSPAESYVPDNLLGGILISSTIQFSVVMAIGCLAGYAVAVFLPREFNAPPKVNISKVDISEEKTVSFNEPH